MDLKHIISNMTLEEKISYCTGADFWHTKAMPQHGIPAIKMSDGPHARRTKPICWASISPARLPVFLRR